MLKWEDMEFVEHKPFGQVLQFDMPSGCDMVVVCVDLTQHTPVQLCHPHQLYKEDLEQMMKNHPKARGITIIPFSVGNKVMIGRDWSKQ